MSRQLEECHEDPEDRENLVVSSVSVLKICSQQERHLILDTSPVFSTSSRKVNERFLAEVPNVFWKVDSWNLKRFKILECNAGTLSFFFFLFQFQILLRLFHQFSLIQHLRKMPCVFNSFRLIFDSLYVDHRQLLMFTPTCSSSYVLIAVPVECIIRNEFDKLDRLADMTSSNVSNWYRDATFRILL